MGSDLRIQLALYGDLLGAELDPVTVEDAESARLRGYAVRELGSVQQSRGEESMRKGALLAVAVFAAIIAVVAAAAVTLRGYEGEVGNAPVPPFHSGDDALIAYSAGLSAGDYDAFNALFVDGLGDFDDGFAPESRSRERYRFISLLYGDYLPDPQCTPASIPRHWDCTMRELDPNTQRLMQAAGVVASEVRVRVYLGLSEDGLISNLGIRSFVGGSEGFSAVFTAFAEWRSENYPQLDAADEALFGSVTAPLAMPIDEHVALAKAAVEEFVSTHYNN